MQGGMADPELSTVAAFRERQRIQLAWSHVAASTVAGSSARASGSASITDEATARPTRNAKHGQGRNHRARPGASVRYALRSLPDARRISP